MIPLAFITLTTPSLNVVLNVVIARMVPEGMLGRMGAVLNMGGTGLKPLGPALGGALAAALGGAAALVVLGGLLGLTAALAALSRELRGFTGRPRRRDPPGKPPWAGRTPHRPGRAAAHARLGGPGRDPLETPLPADSFLDCGAITGEPDSGRQPPRGDPRVRPAACHRRLPGPVHPAGELQPRVRLPP
nr:hypothetical protein GCM10020093_054990 [Planobispora longispora]